MKKFTLLIAMGILMSFIGSTSAIGQNMALNPSYEDWTVNGAGGPADNWTLSSGSMTGAQESTNVRTGTYSTNLTWTTTSTIRFEQAISVTAGNNYSFSFWALDNDPGGRARVAIRWFDSGGGFLDGYYGDYTSDNASWQQLTSGSQTAPAGAVEATIEIRLYDVSAGWTGSATVYVDDAEFVQVTSLEISKAYAISETAVDVQYSAAVTSVAPGDYSLTGTAAITFSGATIDGTDNTIVHLTGASTNMAGDIIVDNLADAANSDNYDFYAGIMPISYTNENNPGGVMNGTETASFSGIISANDEYNNVWISDAAGERNGVMIYSSSFDALVDVGDDILMIGKRDVYNNLNEIVNPELITINSTGNTPYGPDIIPGSDIDQTLAADTDPGEKWEGQLVKIENFTVDSYVDYDYTCSWSDGSNTYYFHVGDNVDYHLNNITLNVGETYGSITGVVDWYSSGPYYRINPRSQSDIVAGAAVARIVGSMQGWNTTDPDYVMSLNANGLYELTKTLGAGDWEYKVVEGDTWGDPNYPGNNQHVVFSATDDVTWKVNIDADLVTHLNPVVAGNFMSAIGGNDWDPTEMMGEMTDPDGDDIFTVELLIPAGNYEAKVTLNHNWDQSTGGNVGFTTDGITPTLFTYDFPNNTTTISGPPPPSVLTTFLVEDTANMMYDGFFLKGSWDSNGQYDPSWGGGVEHAQFYDDGTNGDAVADDHIWTAQVDLVVDNGSNTWEWGVNDTEHNWIAGNWQFTVPDQTPQTHIWAIPDVVDLVINEIMYNSPGSDEEWIELYNNSDATIDLENYRICDNDASHTNIVIPSGYSIPAGGYFTISITTNGNFPFTPDYDGTGNFGLNNGGDMVRVWGSDNLLVDLVEYGDSDPWPTEPDGDGPTLSLIDPDLDNALAESWAPSSQDIGTPGAINFPINVTAPNGGEVIELNSTFDITWTVEDFTNNIDIHLVRDGMDDFLIVSNLASGSGTFSWIPFGVDPASDYKIRITDFNNADVFDMSDDYFTLEQGFEAPALVITEIMYNPPEGGNDSLEFIEIYNNGDVTVDMNGLMFTAGVEFTFPDVDLLPYEYILVGINSNAMQNTFGVTAYQWTAGALSNSGELIELGDGLGNVIDAVEYDDALPWDTLADGYGPSLTLCNPDADNSMPENWIASVNFAAINAAGDSIYATPGFECQVLLLPAFTADMTTVSVGESVIFTDETLGDPIEWIWTFEGGTPETYTGQTPPPITYDMEGLWDVTLYVSDGIENAEITYIDYIEVVNFPPPTNLMAEVGPWDDVQLTWDAPGPSTAELIYDNDAVTGAYSYEGYTMATHMSPEGPCKVLTMKFYTTIDAGDNDFNATIFGWDGTQPGTDVVYMETATAVDDNWMEVDVSGQDITFDGDFVVGFGSINGTTYLGYDANLNNGRSWDFDNATTWSSWSEAYLIRAVVEYSSGKISEIGLSVDYATPIRSLVKSSHPADYSNIEVVKPIDSRITGTRDLLGYNVYRDNTQINAALVDVTEYNDPEPPIGSHDYYVTAVYDGGESEPSNIVSVVVTDIDENFDGNIAIYPNPTEGKFVIVLNAETEAEVNIIDITGKSVYSGNIVGNQEIDVNGIEKGLYLIHISDISNNRVSVKKLIVK